MILFFQSRAGGRQVQTSLLTGYRARYCVRKF